MQEVSVPSGTSNHGVLMVLTIFVLMLIGGLLAYRTNVSDGGGRGLGGDGQAMERGTR